MKVILENRASKYLRKLDSNDYQRIDEALEKLSLEPPEGDIEKLEGKKKEKSYRLRIGDWRILYKVKERTNEYGVTENCIAVYKIASRGQAYKR